MRLFNPLTYDPTEFRGDRDGGFTVLANYIGALGEPQNAKPEKIAMTAPVITKSPPAEKTVTMQFLLPSKYRFGAEAPAPVDGRVAIREEGERKYGAVRFSGTATEETVEKMAEGLRKNLERDGYKVTGRFLLARYNPPWTLPPFRTNEVLIPIE